MSWSDYAVPSFAAGGGSGGGLVEGVWMSWMSPGWFRGGLTALVHGTVLFLTSGSESAVPSSAAGGGSGGGLVTGVLLGSGLLKRKAVSWF